MLQPATTIVFTKENGFLKKRVGYAEDNGQVLGSTHRYLFQTEYRLR